MPILPPKIKDVKKLKPIQVYMLDVLTIGPNLAGIPMVALPNKDSSIHLMADHLDDLTLLSFAQEVAKHG
jgi:Asp-tRNA(Asn)/Glu-tRNA(Gln) amidotransferase A subunit family amidase